MDRLTRRKLKVLGIKGLLKTIYYNFKILPVSKAWRLPILISGKTTIYECGRNHIRFTEEKPRFGLLLLGLSDLEYTYDSPSFVRIRGEMIVRGNGFHVFAPGLCLHILESGVLDLGDFFSVAPHLRITASRKITVGENNMWSFYNLIMDTDAHSIFNRDGELVNAPKPIEFGDNVWMGAYCKILKGAGIPDGDVIGSGSTVTKKLSQCHSVYAGGKFVREDITWSRPII